MNPSTIAKVPEGSVGTGLVTRRIGPRDYGELMRPALSDMRAAPYGIVVRATLQGSTQLLVVRLRGGRSADGLVSVLDDLATQGIMQIADMEILSRDGDRNTAVAIMVVEHLWPARLVDALAGANAELVTDPELPSLPRRQPPPAERLARIQELNELRRMGTLTETEFATAKRDLLSPKES